MSQTLFTGAPSRPGGHSKRTLLDVGLPVTYPQHHLAAKSAGMAITRLWPEATAAILAIAGVIFSVLIYFHPRILPASGSDFKTLYASALCFRQQTDAYGFHNLAAVFQANHVVPPASWYGHSPVYPPFTLAFLAPITLLPMVQAVCVWLALSGLAITVATFALTRVAAERYQLSRPWRFALIAILAASPLVNSGLQLCNVSLVVSSLCVVAVSLHCRGRLAVDLAALCLAIALLLKPHIAIWVILALLISRPARFGSTTDRAVALRALAFFAAAGMAIAAWMAVHHQLLPQLASYRAVVGMELSDGSMSASNRELIEVAAQITSLASFCGYWLRGWSLHVLSMLALAIAGAGLIVASVRDGLAPDAQSEDARFLRIATWSAFGMAATYHRAHDAAILLLLLPYLLACLRRNWRNVFPWAVLALFAALGYGPRWETMWWLETKPGLWHISNFLLYRQSPLAALLLLLILLIETLRITHSTRGKLPQQPLRRRNRIELEVAH